MESDLEQKVSDKKKSTMILLIVFMVIVVPLGYFTKVIPFTFTAINCGTMPVKTQGHVGQKMYTMPGERGYGISMFSNYNYCTEQEAIHAGYERSTLYR